MKLPKPKINIIVFFVFLVLLPLLTILLPKKTFSENENRVLESFPTPTIATIQDKSFMDRFESFFSDHFLFREGWIQIKNGMELATNKKEINGVYLTKDRLIEHQTINDSDLATQNIQAINTFVNKYGIPASLMIVPTAEAIYADSLPVNAPHLDQKAIIDEIYAKAEKPINCIDIFTPLLSKKNQYIYYYTDHHWTGWGAYNGYFSSAVALGFSPIGLEKFNVEHASHDFLGTLYSKTLYDGVDKDMIDLFFSSEGPTEITVTVKSGQKETTYDSIFFRDYLDKKDKYCVYMGQNEPCVTVQTQQSNGKKLLLIKDSYAHSTIQFYMHHYSEITMIDLRYFTNLEQYISINDYDQILFLYNFASMTGDSNIKKLSQF